MTIVTIVTFYRKINILLTNEYNTPDMIKNNWLGIGLLIAVVIWLGGCGVNKNAATQPVPQNNSVETSSGDAKALAQCLTNKGFKLYGASGCGACKKQKELFGEEAAKLLNYVECSTTDGNGQTEACEQAKIEGYPTWEFPNGTKSPGVMTLQQLATAGGCSIK